MNRVSYIQGRFLTERIPYDFIKYKKEVDLSLKLVDDLGISISNYLDVVFYPRPTEIFLEYKLRPRDLYSNWMLEKYKDYLKVGSDSKLLESEFINRSVDRINPTDFEGSLCPNILLKLRKHEVSFVYLINNKEFNTMLRKLPKDMKEEFLGRIDLESVKENSKLFITKGEL